VEAQQIVQQRGGRPRRSGCGLAMSTLHGAGFRVFDKGGKKRSVPIDADVAGAIQTYLLAERPELPLVHCSSSLMVRAASWTGPPNSHCVAFCFANLDRGWA